MWPTIASLGGGLLLGLALAIWAAVERSRRAAVELKLADAANSNASLRKELLATVGTIDQLKEEKARVDKQVVALRGITDDLREKLRACRDPETVRAWLDEELGKQV